MMDEKTLAPGRRDGAFGGPEEARRLRAFLHAPEPIAPTGPGLVAFRRAVHGAWNAVCDQYAITVQPLLGDKPLGFGAGTAAMPRCPGPTDGAFDPIEHEFCGDLADALRVEFHAAGLAMPFDGVR